MISLPGSDVMNGIFLQDGAALVLYCRPMDQRLQTFDTSNEKRFWYDRVSHITTTINDDCDHATNHSTDKYVSFYSYNASTEEIQVTVKKESLKARLQELGIH